MVNILVYIQVFRLVRKHRSDIDSVANRAILVTVTHYILTVLLVTGAVNVALYLYSYSPSDYLIKFIARSTLLPFLITLWWRHSAIKFVNEKKNVVERIQNNGK